MTLTAEHASELLGRLTKTKNSGFNPVSNSLRLEYSPGVCICNKYPEDGDG